MSNAVNVLAELFPVQTGPAAAVAVPPAGAGVALDETFAEHLTAQPGNIAPVELGQVALDSLVAVVAPPAQQIATSPVALPTPTPGLLAPTNVLLPASQGSAADPAALLQGQNEAAASNTLLATGAAQATQPSSGLVDGLPAQAPAATAIPAALANGAPQQAESTELQQLQQLQQLQGEAPESTASLPTDHGRPQGQALPPQASPVAQAATQAAHAQRDVMLASGTTPATDPAVPAGSQTSGAERADSAAKLAQADQANAPTQTQASIAPAPKSAQATEKSQLSSADGEALQRQARLAQARDVAQSLEPRGLTEAMKSVAPTMQASAGTPQTQPISTSQSTGGGPGAAYSILLQAQTAGTEADLGDGGGSHGHSGRPIAPLPMPGAPIVFGETNGQEFQQSVLNAMPGAQSLTTAATRIAPANTGQTAPGAQTPAEQVAVSISAAAHSGARLISIQLKPASLGEIDVELHLSHEGHVRATVSVEKPETLEMLQRDARGLERALQDAGLKSDSSGLNFSLRGEGRHAGGEHRGAPAVYAQTLAVTESELTPAEIAAYSQSGQGRALDIRV